MVLVIRIQFWFYCLLQWSLDFCCLIQDALHSNALLLCRLGASGSSVELKQVDMLSEQRNLGVSCGRHVSSEFGVGKIVHIILIF